MYCPRCGNALEGSFCPYCKEINNSLHHADSGLIPPKVPSYMAHSLILLLLSLIGCFTFIGVLAFPFAIAATVYSSHIKTKLKVGDYDGAYDSSRISKILCIVTLCILIVCVAIYISFHAIGNKVF